MFSVHFSYPCNKVNIEAVHVVNIFKTDSSIEKIIGRQSDDAHYSFEDHIRTLVFNNKKKKAALHTMSKVNKIKIPNISVKLVENAV